MEKALSTGSKGLDTKHRTMLVLWFSDTALKRIEGLTQRACVDAVLLRDGRFRHLDVAAIGKHAGLISHPSLPVKPVKLQMQQV
jgi:hypothetical protein